MPETAQATPNELADRQPDETDDAPSANEVNARFWGYGPGASALDDPTPFGQENALQKLGRPPFEKSTRSKFRVLGYLATVYEHVSQDLGEQDHAE